MKKSIFVVSTIVVRSAIAQQPAASVWTGLQINLSLNEKWQWQNDGGYRTIGVSSSAYQYLYRTGIRYIFSKALSMATGTALFYTRNSYQKSDHEFVREFRGWQELTVTKSLGEKISLQDRFRIEERWFDEVQNKASYFALRFRNRIGVTQRLSPKWSFQLANEYMLQQLKKKVVFNQNRVAAIAAYQFTSTSQAQCGYTFIKRPGQAQHIMSFTFQKNIMVHGNKQRGQK